MADEFAKGFGIAMTAGLGWMVIRGWYNTHEFGANNQLLQSGPENPDVWAELALLTADALFVFALLGPLTFWFLIPAFREARSYLDEASAE
jgi:hypothetical protein